MYNDDPFSISAAEDAFLSNPLNNQALAFDGTSQKWKNLTLSKGNIGLGNVDNTADVNKPISTTQQTALDLKANDNAVVKLTGDQTKSGVLTLVNPPILPDDALTISNIQGLTDALESLSGNGAGSVPTIIYGGTAANLGKISG